MGLEVIKKYIDDHGDLTGLGDDDHTQYLLVAGTRALTGNWDAGSFEIRAQTFQSDVVTGTAPLIVASTTKVTNFNADLLDDQTGSYYLDSANFTGTNWTDLTDAEATTLHKHDHGGMDGLSDDDHTQYALLAGRAGGQTLIGGLNAGNDLTLQSTSNSTKGSILFGTSEYDEVNNRLGIGKTPQVTLDVGGEMNSSYSNVGGDTSIRCINSDNTNALSGAILVADVGGGSAGDPAVVFDITGVNSWACGVDNSDSDKFKICNTYNLTGFDRLAIEVTGKVGIGTSTPTAFLHIDQSSTTNAIPVLTLDQADISEEFIRFIGTSTNAVLTQSLVEEADVTTATRNGWIKVYVQDDGDQITDQSYFIPIFTLS